MSEAATLPAPEFSVSEISQLLRRHIESNFGRVRVRGEISGLKTAASGHTYLSLKDESAVLDAVIWRRAAGGLKFAPEDGLEVVCEGKLSTYAARSRYQLVIERLEPAGEGALMALLEARRKELASEGLFDAERKKPLPFLPELIGVITSPSGSVIRDILHRLQDRFPRHVLVWPVPVQGEGAAEKISAAIEGFNALEPSGPVARPDLLIVARGGGSLEDLWAFNEEIVVRAAAASAIPLISAVGHETDTTLIDLASDLRAPTPSAAAEMAVPVRDELSVRVMQLKERGERWRRRFLERQQERLKGLVRGLRSPQDLFALARQRLDELSLRLSRSLVLVTQKNGLVLQHKAARLSAKLLDQIVSLKRSRYDGLGRLLETLSYRRVLQRGFAVLYDRKMNPVTSAMGLAAGLEMSVELKDGFVPVVTKKDESGAPRSKTRRVEASPSKKDQGSLF